VETEVRDMHAEISTNQTLIKSIETISSGTRDSVATTQQYLQTRLPALEALGSRIITDNTQVVQSLQHLPQITSAVSNINSNLESIGTEVHQFSGLCADVKDIISTLKVHQTYRPGTKEVNFCVAYCC